MFMSHTHLKRRDMGIDDRVGQRGVVPEGFQVHELNERVMLRMNESYLTRTWNDAIWALMTL